MAGIPGMLVSPSSLANLNPIKPGEIRNPLGRKTLGASIKECLNSFAEKDLTLDELKKIAKDSAKGWTHRQAALRMIRSLENPDIADFEPLLDGQMGIRELRAQGVDTTSIKKVKHKTRTIQQGEGNEPIQEVEREIELYDRGLEEARTVMDYTEGRPASGALPSEAPQTIVNFTLKIGNATITPGELPPPSGG